MNADGTVVVGVGSANAPVGINNVEAFRWTQAGGMVGLGLLPGANFSEAVGVNADRRPPLITRTRELFK